jgi:hypothetical protein
LRSGCADLVLSIRETAGRQQFLNARDSYYASPKMLRYDHWRGLTACAGDMGCLNSPGIAVPQKLSLPHYRTCGDNRMCANRAPT